MSDKASKFVEIFENMPDERQEGKVRHKLVDIIFICIVATVAGCDDWEEIEWFANEKEEWFKGYIELPFGIPSHDTLERTFAWLDPDIFLEKFMQWTQGIVSNKVESNNTKGVVAIDGKTMRGSKDVAGNKKALHVVNAWFSETGMILGQADTDEKSNEITAIPELLDILMATATW